jgi:hypothetical protein
MFDWMPVQGWLLIAIAAVAFAPLRYVYRYFVHSPARLDVTQPREDLNWRTPSRLALSLAALALLAGLAVYINTPAAEEFARSPSFWPLVVGGVGAYALFTVIQDLVDGDVEPMTKGGSLGPYAREGHPIRYWLSIAWNMMWASLMLWMAFSWDFSGQ